MSHERTAPWIDQNPIPFPATPTSRDEAALSDLWRLVDEAEAFATDVRRRMDRVLERCAGIELRDAGDLLAFKAAFDRVSSFAGAAPALKDGRPGSLQVRRNRAGKAYTAIAARGTCEYTRAPPNTVPRIILVPTT